METLIRCRRMRRLIWVCTVCLCPTKRMLGLYGLIFVYWKLIHRFICRMWHFIRVCTVCFDINDCLGQITIRYCLESISCHSSIHLYILDHPDLYRKFHWSKKRKIVVIFLSISLNMCFGCSLRRFFWVPTHMFWVRNKKNNFLLRTLIWGPESCWLFYALHSSPVYGIT